MTETKSVNLINFESVYNQYFNDLVKYFRFKVQSLSLAEEIASDTMLKAFKNIELFNPEVSSLKTWIYNIGKNTLIDQFRKEVTPKGKAMKFKVSTDSTVDEEVYQVFQVPDKGIKADSLHDSAIVSTNIKTALNSLKPAQKEIATAFFITELNYNEIAEKFDLPLGTVKGTINRIREKLQSHLKPDYELICQ